MPDLAHFPFMQFNTSSSTRFPGLMHCHKLLTSSSFSSKSGSRYRCSGLSSLGNRLLNFLIAGFEYSFSNPFSPYCRDGSTISSSMFSYMSWPFASVQPIANKIKAGQVRISRSSSVSESIQHSSALFAPTHRDPLHFRSGGHLVNARGGTYFSIISHAGRKPSTWPLPDRRAFFIAFRSGLPRPFRKPGLGVPGPVARDPFVSARLLLPLIDVVEVYA